MEAVLYRCSQYRSDAWKPRCICLLSSGVMQESRVVGLLSTGVMHGSHVVGLLSTGVMHGSHVVGLLRDRKSVV